MQIPATSAKYNITSDFTSSEVSVSSGYYVFLLIPDFLPMSAYFLIGKASFTSLGLAGLLKVGSPLFWTVVAVSLTGESSLLVRSTQKGFFTDCHCKFHLINLPLCKNWKNF